MWRQHIRPFWFAGALAILISTWQDIPANEPSPIQPASDKRQADAARIEQTEAKGATQIKRTVAPVRNAKAEDLAKLLSEHFQRGTDVQILTEPASNALLISAAPEIYDEVLKTLSQLDRPRRSVSVEVVIVEIPMSTEKTPNPNSAAMSLDERDFSGPIERVNTRLKTLVQSGEVVNVKRMRIEAVENESANAQCGAEEAFVKAVAFNQQSGVDRPIVAQRMIGTIVMVMPRITERNEIVMELTVRDDRFFTPEDAPVLGKDENGPIIARSVVSSNATTKIKVSPGQSIVLQSLRSDSKSKTNRFVAIVSAQLGEADSKAKD